MPPSKDKPYFRRQESTRKGQPMRTHHLGYECTYYGRIDRGHTRCVLRREKIPPYLDEDLRSMLPPELVYPCRDHAMAHEMIDMVLQLEVDALTSLASQYPEHDFGFEEFIPWAADRLDLMAASSRRGRLRLPQHPKASEAELILSTKDGPCLIELHILRYPDGDAWGQLTISHKEDILTQSLIELTSDKHTIIKHFPSKYKALDLTLNMPKRLTGVSDKALRRRIEPSSVYMR